MMRFLQATIRLSVYTKQADCFHCLVTATACFLILSHQQIDMILFNAFSEKENIEIFHLELTNISLGTRSGIFSLFVSKQKVFLTTLLVNFLIGSAGRILILKNVLKPGSMTACNIMTGNFESFIK